MFALKKTITPFILPPGIFILAIVFISLVMIYRKRWKLGLANLMVGMMLWALSTVPMANFLIHGLELDYPIPSDPSGDVIILLGGGMIQSVPDLTGTSAPSPSMMGRIVTAVRLFQRLGLPLIVTGGRVDDDADSAVATVAKRFLMDLGVPEKLITVEDRARDTAQNARLTAAICRQQGFSKPILLTAAYHLKRARMAFDAAGMRVTPFPAYFMGSRNIPYTWRHLLPRAGCLCTSTDALHEYMGILFYRMFGP
ncbi:YdcF family protein [uncultured Desulfosarcina sp.]|uniref:YdcF family protein n=1 Tax=uncultured Desulfosarcina sp. TaxID=218289 RepID=UPI0029C935F0|nr:YdcF family protein [uncultured Desulfosarcina sp.]